MSTTLSRKPNGTHPAALIRGMLVLLLCLPRVLLAHDFWIEPDTFRPRPGTPVKLRLYVGQRFSGESIPYLPELFERYVSVGPAGEQPIPGTLGDDPAGGFTPTVPGLYVVVLRTRPAEVSFDSLDEFVQYLRTEGLERQQALSQQRHKAGKPVRETYFRCAKSLVTAGNIAPEARDKALGLPLELIAVTSPYRLAPGTRLRLRLLYKDRPLEGALVVLSNKADPLARLQQRTDKDGQVDFNLPRRGIWLATSVHMLPAPLLSSYDWNSLWASLTFELP